MIQGRTIIATIIIITPPPPKKPQASKMAAVGNDVAYCTTIDTTNMSMADVLADVKDALEEHDG